MLFYKQKTDPLKKRTCFGWGGGISESLRSLDCFRQPKIHRLRLGFSGRQVRTRCVLILAKIKIQFPKKGTVFLVGAAGFGPTRCRSQSPVPYRLATPQFLIIVKTPTVFTLWAYVFYMGWRVGFEPTVFRATI